jgi:ABC-type branched-subunit amino acid transport system substrate-binding protein
MASMRLGRPLFVVALVGSAAALSTNTRDLRTAATISGTQDEPVFEIAVVAKGTQDAKPPKSEDDNVAVGWDLWKGARFAEEELKSNNGPLGWRLLAFDDKNEPASAVEVSRNLRDNPRILAVIGHAFSATTRAAAPSYAQAQIPFVMALATNPSSAEAPSGLRFENAFRLPPGDDLAQAPAIAEFIISRHPGRVHFYVGTRNNANVYSLNIARTAASMIKKALNQDPNVTPLMDLENEAKHIHVSHHNKQDIIVFCGYLDEGNDFLDKVNAQYQNGEEGPAIIFTEGNPRIEERPSHLRVYRMSAFDVAECPDAQAKARPDGEVVTSEFIHGYDAVTLLNLAIKKCSPHVSRSCVMTELSSGNAYPGMCSAYSFQKGENLVSSYFVIPAKSITPAEFDTKISPDHLIRRRALDTFR